MNSIEVLNYESAKKQEGKMKTWNQFSVGESTKPWNQCVLNCAENKGNENCIVLDIFKPLKTTDDDEEKKKEEKGRRRCVCSEAVNVVVGDGREAQDKLEQESKCPLCRKEFGKICLVCESSGKSNDNGEKCRLFDFVDCGHTFHLHCTKKWLNTRSHMCPLCDRKIETPSSRDPVIIFESEGKITFQKMNQGDVFMSPSNMVLRKNNKNETKVTLGNGDIICVCSDECHPSNVTIQVSFPDDQKTEKIEANWNNTLDDIRPTIKSKFGVPIELQSFDTPSHIPLVRLGARQNTLNIVLHKLKECASVIDIFESEDEKTPPIGIRRFISRSPKFVSFALGLSDLFVDSVEWTPSCPQSKFGKSTFLSCLMCASLQVKSSDVPPIITKLCSFLPPSFHKIATSSFTRLFDKELNKITFTDKSVVSNCIFHILNKLMNTSPFSLDNKREDKKDGQIHFPKDTLFEHSRPLFAMLFSSSSSPNDSWKTMVKDVNVTKMFRIVPALSLGSASIPSLTYNETGTLSVFTSRGKSASESVVLFDPLDGSESSIDPHKLAQKVSLLPQEMKDLQAKNSFIDSRPVAEGIIVCLDTSSSMNGPSDFLGEAKVSNQNEKQHTCATWPTSKVDNDNEVTRSKIKRTEAFLKSHPCFEVWRDIGSQYGLGYYNMLRELTSFHSRSSSQHIGHFLVVSEHRDHFCDFFKNPDLFCLEKKEENKKKENTPDEFVCPVGREVMTDPVITLGGNTYDRVNIEMWFKTNNTDPLTGNRIEKKLIPNRALKDAIEKWKNGQKESDEKKNIGKRIEEKTEKKEITVSLKMLTGKSHDVSCYIDDTVYKVKEMCISKHPKMFDFMPMKMSEELTPDKVVLIFQGMQLENFKTLSDYKIETGSTLHAILRNVSTCKITIRSCSLFGSDEEFTLSSSLSVEDLKYHYWKESPSHFDIFDFQLYRFRDIGDGWVSSMEIPDDTSISTLNHYMSENTEGGAYLSFRRKTNKTPKNYLTRLETTKQLIHAFINRSQAYDFPNEMGLILFSDKVESVCEMTPLYETFRDHIDNANGKGNTMMYDAIDQAIDRLERWSRDEKHKDARLRIICLTDGNDTSSKQTNFYSLFGRLERSKIVLDAIMIGDETSRDITRLSHVTGGYCFRPKRLEDALKINELEVFLDSNQRPPLIKDKSFYQSHDLCDEDHQPPHKNTVDIAAEMKKRNITPCSKIPKSSEGPFKTSIKRIFTELKSFSHPSIDVFLSENNIREWRLIVEGPDGTPYSGGTWLVSVSFPDTYPEDAPIVRFMTPIRHCNINVYGRVCHSILKRNYTPSTSIQTILNCVYGLLLQPDVSDPLDSLLAAAFYQGDGQYEASIMKDVKKHALKTRKEWNRELNV